MLPTTRKMAQLAKYRKLQKQFELQRQHQIARDRLLGLYRDRFCEWLAL